MALLNECLPLFEPAGRVTAYAGAAVIGSRFVFISAASQSDGKPTVNQSGAATKPFGVAAYDQATVGGDVVVIRSPRTILPLTAGGTIAAGAEVEVDSAGRPVTLASGIAAGRALTASTVGNPVTIDLY